MISSVLSVTGAGGRHVEDLVTQFAAGIDHKEML